MLKKSIVYTAILLASNAAIAEDCSIDSGFDLNQPFKSLAATELPKWSVITDGAACYGNQAIKNKLNQTAQLMADAALQFAAETIASFLPFPVPLGLIFGGESGPDSTQVILDAINELKIIVEDQNKNMAGYLWLSDLNEINTTYKLWKLDKHGANYDDGALTYSTSDIGFKRVNDLRIKTKVLISAYEANNYKDIGVDQDYFFHAYLKSVQLYLSLEREYFTYRELSRLGITTNSQAEQYLSSENNFKNLTNSVNAQTYLSTASLHNDVFSHFKYKLISILKNKANDQIKNVKATMRENGDAKYGSYATTNITYEYDFGDNHYKYTCDKAQPQRTWTSATCGTGIYLTVNGKRQDRDYVKQFNTMGGIKSFVEDRAYEAHYVNSWGNTIDKIDNWQKNFNKAWAKLDNTSKNLAGGLSANATVNNFSEKSVKRETSSGDSTYVYGIKNLDNVYYQPLAASENPKYISPITEGINAYYGIKTNGLNSYHTHMEVTVKIRHETPKDLLLRLKGPNNKTKTLRANKTSCDEDSNYAGCETRSDINQMFVVPIDYFGSFSNGLFQLIVTDTVRNGASATVDSWQIVLK